MNGQSKQFALSVGLKHIEVRRYYDSRAEARG